MLTDCRFVAVHSLDYRDDLTQVEIGFGAPETFTAAGTERTAVELADTLVAWANNPARGWQPGKLFTAIWNRDGAGALFTLACSFPFDLTVLGSAGPLKLQDGIGQVSITSTDVAVGTWAPAALDLPTPLPELPAGTSARSTTWSGGAVRGGGTAGTAPRRGTLEALANPRAVVRLSSLLQVCASTLATVVYGADDQQTVDWDLPQQDRPGPLTWRVRLPVQLVG